MGLIFHYTTVDALIGMTSNMSNSNRNLTMWATDISCMNDPHERKIGIDLLNLYLEEIEDELKIPVECRMSGLKNSSNNDSKLLNKNGSDECLEQYNVYITSFSNKGDSLPMWSMYAKNGNGISLGFDLESIKRKLPMSPTVINDMFYDNMPDIKIKELLKRYYNFTYNYLNGYKTLFEKFYCGRNINEVISMYMKELYVLIVSSFIKHHSYEYENEVRLCCIDKQPMKFRSSNGFIVPYIDYKLPIDSLKKIIVGPTLDYERIIKPLISLFRSRGIDITKIEIEKSNIPYRG